MEIKKGSAKMLKAKVVLRGARTYTFGGKRWIKDVPCIVTDDDIKQYRENGYFYVAMLQSSGSGSKKEKASKRKKSSSKKAKPKSGAKKKAKLKKNKK